MARLGKKLKIKTVDPIPAGTYVTLNVYKEDKISLVHAV